MDNKTTTFTWTPTEHAGSAAVGAPGPCSVGETDEWIHAQSLNLSVLDFASDLVLLANERGIVYYCNHATRSHYGIDTRVPRAHLKYFWCGPSIDDVGEAVRLALDTGQTQRVDCRCGDRMYEIALSPFRAGESRALACVARDVTQRQEQHHRDIDSRDRIHRQVLGSIFSASPWALALFSGAGALVESNAAFENLRASLCDTASCELSTVLRALGYGSGLANCPRGTAAEGAVVVQSDDAGEPVHLEWCLERFADECESEASFVVTIHDVSDRVREDQRRLLEQQSRARHAERRLRELSRSLDADNALSRIRTCDPAMTLILKRLPTVAATTAPVLIRGANGTGKELIARAIHDLSTRSDGPFVAVNCGALPESLAESELFGHVAGAFTDAKKARAGRFQQADGGTLLLDEIGEVPQTIQTKLLRVVQHMVVEPLGANESETVDVRVLAATNRDLEGMVREGTFREDLYYRLNVVPVSIPSLSERPGDIPLLIDHFLRQFNAKYGKDIEGVDNAVMYTLGRYAFPGNVRELENALEHAFVFCEGPLIRLSDLPQSIAESIATLDSPASRIQAAVAAANGNMSEAARSLGIHRTTLYRQMRKMDIHV